MRTRRSAWRILALVTLLTAAIAIPAAPANAAPLGAISGKVVGPNGKPLKGIAVAVYPASESKLTDGAAKIVKTTKNGSYKASGLKAGRYRVEFGDQEASSGKNRYLASGRSYASRFWKTAWTITAAPKVAVKAGTTTSKINEKLGLIKTFHVGTATVSIDGSWKTGSAVKVSTSGWTPAPTSLSYAWKRGAKVVGGSASHKLLPADVTGKLTVEVTAARGGYRPATLTRAVSRAEFSAAPVSSPLPPVKTQLPPPSGPAAEASSLADAPTPSGAVDSTLDAISCAAASSCVALGKYSDGASAPSIFADTLNGGVWTTAAISVPSALASPSESFEIAGISCPAPGSCAAAAYAGSHSLILTLASGTWTVEEAPLPSGQPGGQLVQVSCATSVCAFRGEQTDSSGGRLGEQYLVTGRAGQWTATPGPTSASGGPGWGYLLSVACGGTNTCFAVGQFLRPSGDGEGDDQQRPLVSEFDGSSWSAQVLELPNPFTGSLLTQVACDTSGDCAAVGPVGTATGLIVTRAAGSTEWTAASTAIPSNAASTTATSLSCPTLSGCILAGSHPQSVYDASGAYVSTEEVPVVIAPFQPSASEVFPLPWASSQSPNARFTSISCASAGHCIAAGVETPEYGDGSAAFAVNDNGTRWSGGGSVYYGCNVGSPGPSCGSFTATAAAGSFGYAVGYREAVTPGTNSSRTVATILTQSLS